MDYGDSAYTLYADSSKWRRFRLSLALRAIEDALRLLDPAPAEGLEIRALERVRDDLEVILRIDELERL
jgi:DNA transposition AAA+ family ATPase